MDTTNDDTDDARTPDPFADPETLRGRDGVEFTERTVTVDPDEFDEGRDDLAGVAGWAVVGVPSDAGSVLLMDDGDHGWTLPARSVGAGDDWLARGREAVEGLTGEAVTLEGVARVRRLDYREEGGDGRVTVHHVVMRAAPVTGEPVAAESSVGCEDVEDAGWFEALPEGVEGAVADDARLFL